MSPSPRPRSRNGWRALLDEARRREVPRALLLYGGVAWATVTASPDLIQWLGAPTWIFGALVLALALGLPVVLWASWTLDFSVRAEAEWPGGDLAPAGEDVEELTPADVERIGFGRREKLLGLAIPVVLLFVFPFLVRWAVTPEPGAGLTVAIQASEGTASVLGPPLEWFLDARTVMVVPGSGSLEEALAGARRVGARYLVRGDSVSALLFEVDSGARMEVLPGGGLGAGAEESAGRLSVQLVRAIAEREGRALPVEPEVISHTSSPVALLHLMEGRRHFGHAEFEDAMAAYRLSVEADSAFVPAYYRLAVAHQWLWSYDVGWDVLARGSVRGDPSPRWARLLEAGRRYLERDA